MRASELIAIGSVSSIRLINPEQTPDEGSSGPVEITFSVDEYLSGSGPQELPIIQTSAVVFQVNEAGHIQSIYGTSCDIFGAVGDRYVLVPGRDEQGRYTVGACGISTKILTNSDEAAIVQRYRAALQEPTATSLPPTAPFVLPPSGTGSDESSGIFWPLVGAAAAGALLASTALVSSRARR